MRRTNTKPPALGDTPKSGVVRGLGDVFSSLACSRFRDCVVLCGVQLRGCGTTFGQVFLRLLVGRRWLERRLGFPGVPKEGSVLESQVVMICA